MTADLDLSPETVARLLEAAVAEYSLEPPMQTSEERLGRGAAIRGMMVRLNLYKQFTETFVTRERARAALAADTQPAEPDIRKATKAMVDAAFRALPADAHGTIGSGEMYRVLDAALAVAPQPALDDPYAALSQHLNGMGK